MKTLLSGLFVALVAFTVAMLSTRPVDARPGLTPLVWVTDPNPMRDAQTALFGRLNPGLDLKIDPGNTDRQKIIVQSLAGVGPDIFNYYGESDMRAYVTAGIAYDLTDSLRADGIDMPRDAWSMCLPQAMIGDRIYGVPRNCGVDAIWFYKDLFDASGVPYPKPGWNNDDLVQTALRLTKRDAKGRVTQYGLLIDFGRMFSFSLPSYGGTYFNPQATRCILDSPEALECLTFIHDLIYKYKVAPSPADESSITSSGGWGGTAGPQAYFRKRVGAMAFGGRWWSAQLRLDVKSHGYPLSAVVPPIARYPKFQGGGGGVMVNALSPRRAQAVKFASFLLGKPYNVLLNDQADALAPLRALAYTDRYLHNPEHPEEDYNAAWRDASEMAIIYPISPYITQTEFDTFLNRQLDLCKLDQKTPAAALRDATRDINAAIVRNAERDPELRAKFAAAGGGR